MPRTSISIDEYSIHVGDFWEKLEDTIKRYGNQSIALLVDENTKKHCLPIIKKRIDTVRWTIIEIPSGEHNKTIDTCKSIWLSLLEAKIQRNGLLLNLGGGVVGDMGGFCASTYKRGIDFIHIPTTLLSQVDASIGGKLGVDFHGIKNCIGCFKNPKAVFIWTSFLDTLPRREQISGFAEIVKHALIKDNKYWESLQGVTFTRRFNWDEFVLRSLEIKKEIVIEDPFEKGARKALNFGHTIGHAVESYFLDTSHPLLHGEAIAVGIICESYLSYLHSTLSRKKLLEIASFINRVFPQASLPDNDYIKLLGLMQNDKKNNGKGINFTLLKDIGSFCIDQIIEEEHIIEALNFYMDTTTS